MNVLLSELCIHSHLDGACTVLDLEVQVADLENICPGYSFPINSNNTLNFIR